MFPRRSISILFLMFAVFVFPCAAKANDDARQDGGPAVGDNMLRRMIGQMILVGFVGDKAEDEGFRTVLDQASKGKIGGVIYLRRNIRSLRAVSTLNSTLQGVSDPALLIAVDQEGGRIERLTKAVGFSEAPSAAAVARKQTPQEAEALYARMAGDLSGIGFNLNLGPVVDIDVNPDNPIIGKLERSFSRDGATVSSYARSFVRAHRSKGVLTSLKHFPGHGSSVADTHKGTADVSRTWSEKELEPYKDLIESGDADMIMAAHVINRNVPGAGETPASLSPATLTALLRKEMKFAGVVISDDLQMGAIIKTRSLEDTVRQAVLAGNDILIFANDKNPDPQIPEKVAELLVQDARSNPVMLARIQESYMRITLLKHGLAAAKIVPERAN